MADWTERDMELLRELAEQGASPLRISVKLKRTVKAVQQRARASNIVLKNTSDVRRSFGLASHFNLKDVGK